MGGGPKFEGVRSSCFRCESSVCAPTFAKCVSDPHKGQGCHCGQGQKSTFNVSSKPQNRMRTATKMAQELDKRNSVLWDGLTALLLLLVSLLRSCLAWVLPRRYKDISEDVVLITGGGKGIGRLLAVELAKYTPKHIVLWGRQEDSLAATAKAIRLHNVACTYMVCDVGDRDMVIAKGREVEETVGHVTILINNAGIVFGGSVLNSRPDEIRKTLDTNTLAHFWTAQAFLPHMMEVNHGHVVIVNSMLGMMGLAGAADYSASKHAALGMSDSLQMELLTANKTGIFVTSIHPYMVNTEMFAGCTTRFPSLFPPLDKEYVVWRTVDAILRNQPQVLMPRMMYLAAIVQRILPLDCIQIVQRFTGVDTAMSSFHKQTKKDS